MKNFELLFNEISDALFLHDFEGKILKVNDHACKRLGYSKEEFATMNVDDFAPDDIVRNWEERIKTIKNKGQLCFETTYLTKDQLKIDVEIVSKIIAIENTELILSSGRDISKRKNYESQLKEARNVAEENELELKTIFNKAPSTIILFDEESRIIRINEKGILKFKVDTGNLENKKIGDVLNCLATQSGKIKCGSTERCLKCQLAEIIRQTIQNKVEFTKKEFSISVVQANAVVEKTMLISTAFLHKGGKKLFLATIDDITSRKQMELELVAAKEKAEESEKLKTAFLNNISHEIRTPLNGILGFIHLFEDDYYNFSKEEKKGFIEIMQKSGERLVNTVTDLVEVAKLDSGIDSLSEENIDLFNELRHFLKEQKSRYGNPKISFEFEINSALKNQRIIIDKIKLCQILKNLINNAFKFTSKGWVKVLVTTNVSNLVFSIEDTGIGIDAKDCDFIYEPFRQAYLGFGRMHEGVGLGLTIAKKLVQKMYGNIWFDSKAGKGTTFYFSIPLKVSVEVNEISDDSQLVNKNDSELAGKKILIAEDEISNYLLLQAILEKEKCLLVHAFNGKEAVEIFTEDSSFDLVIMDIKMPLMNGIEATRKIKKIRSDVPVVAYSAYDLNGDKQKAIEAGCVDFLSKPVEKETIVQTIVKNLSFSNQTS